MPDTGLSSLLRSQLNGNQLGRQDDHTAAPGATAQPGRGQELTGQDREFMLAFLAHAEPASCPRSWSACRNSAIKRTSGQCWAAGLGLNPVPRRVDRLESHKQNTVESRARTGDFRDAAPWRLGHFRPTLQVILQVTTALPWQVAAPPYTSAPAIDLTAASPTLL